MIEINEETERQHRQDLAELAENVKHSLESQNMLSQANFARKAMYLLPRIMEHNEARFTHLFEQLVKIDKARGGQK